MNISKTLINDLRKKAQELRRNIIFGIGIGCAGYVGGNMSAADVIAALYFGKMRRDAENKNTEKDYFILSKGHAAMAQYAALAMCGYFPVEELAETRHPNTRLQGFVDYLQNADIGIDAPAGSLGYGLSVAVGLALGLRLDGSTSKVYVLVGDGEMAAGQIWEAAMAAANFGLSNLVMIIDKNRMQAQGLVADRLNQGVIAKKMESFGFDVTEIDGHDMGEIMQALNEADNAKLKPTAIIASTTKGKGLDFAERHHTGFHYETITSELYSKAMDVLGGENK